MNAWASEYSRGVERIDAENWEQYLLDRQERTVLTPHIGQTRAMASNARIVSVQAGWRSGKSISGPPWLLREIQRCGPGDYSVVCPTIPLLDKTVRPAIKYLFQTVLGLGEIKTAAKMFVFSRVGQLRLFGKEGDTRILFGHGSDPDSLESATFKAVWGDEAGQAQFSQESHETLVSRVTLNEGRILYTSRPYGFDWFKTLIHDKKGYLFWMDDKKVIHEEGDVNSGDIHVFCYSSLMNPAFKKKEYFRIKADMSADKFGRKYGGLFIRPAGAIYDCFDRKKHVVRRFSVTDDAHKGWPRYWGMDFGPINTACVMLVENPVTKELYVYKTYHPGKSREISEHIKELTRLGSNILPISCFGGSRSEQEWRDDFTAEGLPVMDPFIKGVEEQISRVYGALVRGELKIFDDCYELIEEIEKYSWELDDEGEAIENKIEDKSDYHLADALRYVGSSILPGTYDSTPVIIHRTNGKPKSDGVTVGRHTVEFS